MQLHLEHNGPVCAYGNVGPVCVVLWKGELTGEHLDAFTAYVEAVGRERGDYVVLSFPSTSIKPPGQDVRRRIAELTSNPSPHFRGSSTVVDAEGFAASVLRSALAGLSLMGAKGATEHVARSADDGLEYLSRRVKLDLEPTRVAVHEFLKIARAKKS